jgi:hypothetical protein
MKLKKRNSYNNQYTAHTVHISVAEIVVRKKDLILCQNPMKMERESEA